VPGYEPFVLCDFHVHTRWSDGRLSLRDTIDLYGRTGKFDVIAITDHILMKRDLLARAGRVATLGRCSFGIAEDQFQAYLEDIAREAERARREYDLLVVPGAEITQNKLRGKKNAHIIALALKRYISADQTPDDILKEIRRQGALSITLSASPRRAPARDQYLLPLGSPLGARGPRGRLGSSESRRSLLGHQSQTLSIRGEQRLPQAEAPLLVENVAARREGMARDPESALRQRRRRVDTVSQGLVEAGGNRVDRRASPRGAGTIAVARREVVRRASAGAVRGRWPVDWFVLSKRMSCGTNPTVAVHRARTSPLRTDTDNPRREPTRTNHVTDCTDEGAVCDKLCPRCPWPLALVGD